MITKQQLNQFRSQRENVKNEYRDIIKRFGKYRTETSVLGETPSFAAAYSSDSAYTSVSAHTSASTHFCIKAYLLQRTSI